MKTLAAAVLVLVALPRSAGAQSRSAGAPQPGRDLRLAPFSLEAPDRQLRLALTGYVQRDFRSYSGWTAEDPEGGSLRAPTAEWQRVRLGLEGRWRALDLRVETGPSRTHSGRLKDAWLGLRLASGLRLRVGRQKLPGSAEWLMSNARTDFLERAAVVDALSPGRELGVQILADGRRVTGQAGVFRGDESPGDRNAGRTLAGRVVAKPWSWLDVGVSASHGDVTAPAGTDARPKGFRIDSLTGFRVFGPVFSAGSRRRLGADAVLRTGPFGAHAEYLERREERRAQGPAGEDLPAVLGRGFAVSSTWLVTGERKAAAIRPRRPLPNGPGAIEVALGCETLRADDVANAAPLGEDSRAANVRHAGLRSAQLGVSWWPVAVVRLMANAVVERYTDADLAPEPGRAGNYLSLLVRAQVSLP